MNDVTLNRIELFFATNDEDIENKNYQYVNMICFISDLSKVHFTMAPSLYAVGRSCRNNSLRNILTLNNIGVSLLEQRSYKQAKDTFKESISLTNIASITDSSRDVLYNNAEVTLKHACRRLANPRPVPILSCPDPVFLETVTYENNISALKDILNNGPSSSYAFAIRIEAVDELLYTSKECADGNNVALAVLFYNLGLAKLCMSSIAKTTARAVELRKGALKLFRRSYRIIITRAFMEQDESRLRCFLLLSAVVNCLNRVSRELGESTKGTNFYDQLVYLRDLIYGLEQKLHALEFSSQLAEAA